MEIMHIAPSPTRSYSMIVQIKAAKTEDRSTEVCNWVLGGCYKLYLSSNSSLSCALVVLAPWCRRTQVCGITQAVGVVEVNRTVGTCLNSCTSFLCLLLLLPARK